MTLPPSLIQSLQGIAGFNEPAFIAAHTQPKSVTSIRINAARQQQVSQQISGSDKSNLSDSDAITSHQHSLLLQSIISKHLQITTHQSPFTNVPWCGTGCYLPQRPSFTFDPLFHAGAYYVQEASSMFVEQALRQLCNLQSPLKVLDLCASPGGKSTHIQSLLSADSILVSNEMIKGRSVVLADNIIKWGCTNVVVSCNNAAAFQKLPGYFDVLLVDAPCSGSGLFRKDEAAMEEWSPAAVQLCSQRQQRILADALPCLKEGGLLIYSTCSYSGEEDESIADWLVTEEQMLPEKLSVAEWPGIVAAPTDSGAEGYRFFPDRVDGEGFYLACFRKTGAAKEVKIKVGKPTLASANEREVLTDWIAFDGLNAVPYRDELLLLTDALLRDWSLLSAALYIVYAGTTIGQVLKNKLVPHHSLAQSIALRRDVPATELSYDEAIRYLQRADLSISPKTTGWQVVRYAGYNLGWVNALAARINNYYPKEIRILRQEAGGGIRKL